MYEFRERVRYSEVEENGKMGLLGMVNLLQDCSTFHSHDVGMSIERLKAEKKAWFLSAWDIQLRAFPELYEERSLSVLLPTSLEASLPIVISGLKIKRKSIF